MLYISSDPSDNYPLLQSYGGSIGYLHRITNMISAGVWGSLYMRSQDGKLGYLYGAKIVVGDPRNLAISMILSKMPSVGLYFKNVFLEFSPLILVGIDNAYMASVGYSVSL